MKSCILLLEQMATQAAPSEMNVAQYILAHPKDAASMGITELAQASSSSTAAITRLCKHLGFKGFSDLKFALIKDVYSNKVSPKPDILDEFQGSGLPASILIPKFINLASHGLGLLGCVLDDKSVDTTADLIVSAKSIGIFGMGASSVVGMDFMYKLARLGKKTVYSRDPDLQKVQACALGPEDLAIIISYSGETDYLVTLETEAKANGCKVVTLTKVGKNRIAKAADVSLQIPVSESEYRQGATLSRLNQLVVIDILYGAVLGRLDEPSKKMLKHSWDSVGPKLNK